MPRKGTIPPDVASSELAANRKSKSKARKTKVEVTQAENQEVVTTEGENTMNVTQVEAPEVTTEVEVPEIPATIVESSEAEIFAEQTEGQEVVNTTVEEAVAASDGDTATPPVEQAAPKPPKVSKRPYIALIEQQLELGNLDKKELLALIMDKFPEVSKNGASTFLTDALNPKYSHWKDRVVSKTVDGKLIFADKIEAPAPDVQPAEAQPEQPAE
jgi:fibronectin type 3 domain-containing protein